MYLNEAKDERTKKDLAMIIEEILNQRILGVKNEKGIYITPAFPNFSMYLKKIIYQRTQNIGISQNLLQNAQPNEWFLIIFPKKSCLI